MRPTLFTVLGRRVSSYPAMFVLGVSLGALAQNAAANAAGLPSSRVYAATMVLLPLALVGARLLYVAGHWRDFEARRRHLFDRASGGMVLYGGLLVMLPASLAVLAVADLPYWRFWDVTSFLILLAMMCTRVGCLLNGCCAGRITRSRLGFSSNDVTGLRARRFPMQLLEAAVGALLLVAAVVLAPLLDRPGELFLLLLAGYAAFRAVVQPLRAEQKRGDPTLLLSLMLVALSLVGVVLMRT
jgi:phosphatidylglycerol---prolipoprotein diacylglyceryl transferase